jgi:predicted TIM-barrel fold metal-dependent hydrolase
MDWQWINIGPYGENPEIDRLPSEYFKRQVYGSFWFEEGAALDALPRLPDNILYETDFPHPTSISPGRFPFSKTARDDIERKLAAVPEDVLRKVLHDNAARVYNIG